MKTKPKARKLTKAQRSRGPNHAMEVVAKFEKQQELAAQARIQEEQARIQAILDTPHTFSMEFILERVKEKLQAFHDQHGLTLDTQDKGIFIPESVVIDAYNQDDLIIALKLQQVTCMDWLVGVDTHLYNRETDEVLTVPFQVRLDGLTYLEVNHGAKVSVERKGGFKTRWKGLEKELNNHYKEYDDHDLTGFKIVQTQIKIVGDCHFINYSMYKENLFLRGLRSEGVLIQFLEDLTKTQVKSGELDYQLQPIDKEKTAIPVGAFAALVEEAKLQNTHTRKSIAA